MQDTAEASDEEPELDVGGSIIVPGASKVARPISLKDLFLEDAEKRNQYINLTSMHSSIRLFLTRAVQPTSILLSESEGTSNFDRRSPW